MRHLLLSTAAFALALASAAGAGPSPAPAPRVLIASDSTAAEYSPARYPQMGWGMVLKCSLDPQVRVLNLARGGRSTKTYMEEGLWGGLVSSLGPGDTVLIQFGHNDEDRTRMFRHTEPDAFAANLRRMVADVRGKGAQPVLVTPIARHVFENGRAKDAHARYAAAIRNVAAETSTPLIDLDADSMAYLDRLGEEASKNLFLIYTPADRIPLWPEGHKDTTHFNERGARVGAALVAAQLKALNLPVSRHVRPQGSDEPPVLGRPDCP